MSTLVENVEKVKNAHAALKTAIAAKGVAVPENTKLTDMPALVEQISTEPVPTNLKAAFAYDTEASIIVPKTMVVDMLAMTDLTYCFFNCNSATTFEFPAGFGQNAVHLGGCFASCINLTTLILPDGFGQNAQTLTINRMSCFQNCPKLTTVHLPTGFGQNSTVNGNIFYGCRALTTITGNPNFKSSLVFSACPNLTHDSLMVVINGLQTVTST